MSPLAPFWLSATMDRESVLFLNRNDGREAGQLLFAPDTVTRVTDAAGVTVYADGRDYTVDDSRRCLVRTAGSRIPACVAPPEADSLTQAQLSLVSYTHREPWDGVVPQFGGEWLPRTLERLRDRRGVTISLTGDSISEGYDASGFHGFPPYQPPFARLVAASLNEHYDADVRLHNVATAGWTAADGVSDLDRIVAPGPDLVIIAYGLNDASYASAGELADNVTRIIAGVRSSVPDAEFLLVSPMRPTAECTWVVAARFGDYRDALLALAGPGVAIADVTGLWSGMLARKDPRELSGNWLNHPNDFGHRVYAQALLAVLVDPRAFQANEHAGDAGRGPVV